MKKDYIECICNSEEHLLIFSTEGALFEYGELMVVSHFLGEIPFHKRLWRGIKYIFGYKCSYGHFQESCLGYQQVMQLKELCDKALQWHNERVD